MHASRLNFRFVANAAALGLFAAATALAPQGCSEEAPPPPPPAPPKAEEAPPPPPAVTPVAQLMKELGISAKIRLPEEKAPATTPERVAVLKFFDAFAKSTPEAAKGAMSPADREVLEVMVKSGALKPATQAIERIDLATNSIGGKSYIVAVIATGTLYQPQLWSFHVEGEDRTIKSQTFESYAQLPRMLESLHSVEDQMIPEWIDVIAKEHDQIKIPDEILKVTARTQKEGTGGAEGSGGSTPKGPVGAPPMRRIPTGPPIKPPDFKPGSN